MATCVWAGHAEAVQMALKFTPANVETTDIFTLTCGGESVSFTATAATVANVTAGLTAAWNASTYPAHAEIAASDDTTHVTLTHDMAGVEFDVSSSTTDGGGTDDQTLTKATVTAGAGPNFWNTLENWVDGAGDQALALPASDDTVYIENSSVDILYGLGQSAVDLVALHIKKSYTGKIGLPRWNSNGYWEYRNTYLQIGSDATYIGMGLGDGSGRIKIDLGTSDGGEINIWGTGTRAETGIPALLFKSGTPSSNDHTLRLYKGSVGIGFFGGETADLKDIEVSFLENSSDDSHLIIGNSVTLTGGSLTMDGGTVELSSSCPTITMRAGILYLYESAAVSTSLTIDNGTCYHRSNGTIAALHLAEGGTFDCRGDNRARIVSNCDMWGGGNIYDPFGTVTWSNAIHVNNTNLQGVTISTPESKSWSYSGT